MSETLQQKQVDDDNINADLVDVPMEEGGRRDTLTSGNNGRASKQSVITTETENSTSLEEESTASETIFTILTPFLAVFFTIIAVTTCNFFQYTATPQDDDAILWDPTRNQTLGLEGSIGIFRMCDAYLDYTDKAFGQVNYCGGVEHGASMVPKEIRREFFDRSEDTFMQVGFVFAILSIVLGVLPFLLLCATSTDGELVIFGDWQPNETAPVTRKRRLLWSFPILYALNTICVLLTLLFLANEACESQQCSSEFFWFIPPCTIETFYQEDPYIFCIDECKPSTGVVLVVLSSLFWFVSCIGTARPLLKGRQVGIEQDKNEASIPKV